MKLSRLKFVALALAGIGMLISNELQKREIREAVDERLEERGILDPPDSQYK